MIKRCKVCNGKVKYDEKSNKYICLTCGQEYLNEELSKEEKENKKAKDALKKAKKEAKLKENKKEVKEKTKKEKANTENLEDKSKNKLTKTILIWLLTIFLCLGAAKLFTTYVVSSVEVSGLSMYPTLSDGDKALTDALFYKMTGIKRFDIVIIDLKHGSLKGEKIVKRVIGLPGEKVAYKDKTLYINDKVVKETFISDDIKENTQEFEEILKNDEYFVMGDNRSATTDSTSPLIGHIKKNEIVGRGLVRFMKCSHLNNKNKCDKRKLTWFDKID